MGSLREFAAIVVGLRIRLLGFSVESGYAFLVCFVRVPGRKTSDRTRKLLSRESVFLAHSPGYSKDMRGFYQLWIGGMLPPPPGNFLDRQKLVLDKKNARRRGGGQRKEYNLLGRSSVCIFCRFRSCRGRFVSCLSVARIKNRFLESPSA